MLISAFSCLHLLSLVYICCLVYICSLLSISAPHPGSQLLAISASRSETVISVGPDNGQTHPLTSPAATHREVHCVHSGRHKGQVPLPDLLFATFCLTVSTVSLGCGAFLIKLPVPSPWKSLIIPSEHLQLGLTAPG